MIQTEGERVRLVCVVLFDHAKILLENLETLSELTLGRVFFAVFAHPLKEGALFGY